MRIGILLGVLSILTWIVFWEYCLVGFVILMALGTVSATMEGKMDTLKIWLAVYGTWIGLGICTLILAWDLIPWVRGFMEYSIRGYGALGLICGVTLMVVSYSLEKWLG